MFLNNPCLDMLDAAGAYMLDASNADALSEGEVISQTFQYTVADNHGAAATADFTVTITGQNDGPVAGSDAATANENASAVGNVLANDSDIDRLDTISVQSFNGGALGQAVAINNAAGATVRGLTSK